MGSYETKPAAGLESRFGASITYIYNQWLNNQETVKKLLRSTTGGLQLQLRFGGKLQWALRLAAYLNQFRGSDFLTAFTTLTSSSFGCNLFISFRLQPAEQLLYRHSRLHRFCS
jgi:hypothetical protein